MHVAYSFITQQRAAERAHACGLLLYKTTPQKPLILKRLPPDSTAVVELMWVLRQPSQ